VPDLTAPAPDGLPVITPADTRELAAWFDAHAATARGVWVRMARKASGIATVTHADLVEVALCHGWIDSQMSSEGAPWSRQRLTPRTPRSRWSQVNRAAAQDLIDRGLMRAGGLREVQRAQADGRWEAAYPPPSTATVPDDLQAALDAVPAVAAAFARLDGRNRYAVLHQVGTAKRVATRARRIEEAVRMLAEGRTPYPPRAEPPPREAPGTGPSSAGPA
jgi:uncharacterized protein YdeI (YjbR/CyaY-like superfamily)